MILKVARPGTRTLKYLESAEGSTVVTSDRRPDARVFAAVDDAMTVANRLHLEGWAVVAYPDRSR